MSQPYVAGPSEIYIHDGSNFLFLGYSESGARVQWTRFFEDYFTDKSGSKMPADKQYMGLGALVSCDLTHYNHSVLSIARKTIRNRAFGALGYGDIGQMMIAQGNTYRLNIKQPYADPALWGNSNLYPNMPLNVHFSHAILIDESETMGTKRKIHSLVWEMMCYVNPCTGVGVFVDTNPGTLPSPC